MTGADLERRRDLLAQLRERADQAEDALQAFERRTAREDRLPGGRLRAEYVRLMQASEGAYSSLGETQARTA